MWSSSVAMFKKISWGVCSFKLQVWTLMDDWWYKSKIKLYTAFPCSFWHRRFLSNQSAALCSLSSYHASPQAINFDLKLSDLAFQVSFTSTLQKKLLNRDTYIIMHPRSRYLTASFDRGEAQVSTLLAPRCPTQTKSGGTTDTTMVYPQRRRGTDSTSGSTSTN